MKALLSTATGGPETLVLGELPEPLAGAGQVVVAVDNRAFMGLSSRCSLC